MRNILGRHRLQAVAVAVVVLTLVATPSAGTIRNAGMTHNHDAHVHSADATAVASAEPDHTATLNRANPKFTWEGSGSGVPDRLIGGQPPVLRCTGGLFKCDYILLLVEKAGVLTLTLENTDDVDPSGPREVCRHSSCELVHDIDGYLYRSNAAGEPVGKTLTRDCLTLSSSETCKVSVGPGFHVVEVEYYLAVEAHYIGTVELAVARGRPATQPQTVTVEGCNFTQYYFKDSAERMQALVPPDYRVAPYLGTYLSPAGFEPALVTTEGSATISAAAFDCDRIEVPGSSPAPGIFTVLSVLVYPPDGNVEGPATGDFYVLWIHANNPDLVELLESGGMPAYLVPGMVFEKPLQSVAVRVEVPWSPSAYELATTGVEPDVFFHDHDNTYLHVAEDGRPVRMDFVANQLRDQYCSQPADHHAIECGRLTAESGTPVASFFGASDRSADTAWDHAPFERAWFFLQ